ncbi:MAG TPA: PaaI family thioesterase [Myxococcota bacterium]|jgi:acyl-coenzyme A thioesterase PaaI-like protein|nr:PaaI family thioesterase [Myxococcota bacterium]
MASEPLAPDTEAPPVSPEADPTKRGGALASLARLADSVRRLVDRVISLDAPSGALDPVADSLDALTDALVPWHGRRPIPAWSGTVDRSDPNAFLPWSPMIGRYNPLAPPIELTIEGDTVVGRARFGAAYEGPPGCVHGAIVAGAFDQVLALVNVLVGHPAMTGTLTIKYRRPTPLHEELRFVARTDRVEGRKVFASATLHAGETLVAESEGVFILVTAMPAVP